MKIKFNSIADLPIAKYLDLQKILKEAKSESFDDTDLNVQMLSIFTDIPEEDIYNSSLFDIGIAMGELRTALEQPMPPQPNKMPKTLKLNGVVYEVVDDVADFTVAQYIDFQNYVGKDEYITELLATFIIPQGFKYNDGYNIDSQIADFKKFLTIGTAVSLRFFFVKKLLTSTVDTLKSLEEQMMRRQMKKELKTLMMENRLRMNEAVRAILRHLRLTRGSH